MALLDVARRPAYGRAELRRLIDPATVAVVGLSRNGASFGARTARNLMRFGGRGYGVNPGASELHGLPCFPTIAAIPEPVDCAILAVPLDSVEGVVGECAAAGVGACVIFASGFAETGRADRIALQDRLAAIAREADMRIVGPVRYHTENGSQQGGGGRDGCAGGGAGRHGDPARVGGVTSVGGGELLPARVGGAAGG